MNEEIRDILNTLHNRGYSFVLIIDEGNKTGLAFSNMPPARAVSLVTGVTKAMANEIESPMNN